MILGKSRENELFNHRVLFVVLSKSVIREESYSIKMTDFFYNCVRFCRTYEYYVFFLWTISTCCIVEWTV